MFSNYSLDDLIHNDFKLSLALDNQLVQECKLIEPSPNTKNPELNVMIKDDVWQMIVFKSDKRSSNNQEDNILRYFNHTISDLTKIPDYIIFIEKDNVVNVVIIEMKSETYESRDIAAKFRNGKIIADYLIAITGRQMNKIKSLLSLKPCKKTTTNIRNQKKFSHQTDHDWYIIKSKRFNAFDLLDLS